MTRLCGCEEQRRCAMSFLRGLAATPSAPEDYARIDHAIRVLHERASIDQHGTFSAPSLMA